MHGCCSPGLRLRGGVRGLTWGYPQHLPPSNVPDFLQPECPSPWPFFLSSSLSPFLFPLGLPPLNTPLSFYTLKAVLGAGKSG